MLCSLLLRTVLHPATQRAGGQCVCATDHIAPVLTSAFHLGAPFSWFQTDACHLAHLRHSSETAVLHEHLSQLSMCIRSYLRLLCTSGETFKSVLAFEAQLRWQGYAQLSSCVHSRVHTSAGSRKLHIRRAPVCHTSCSLSFSATVSLNPVALGGHRLSYRTRLIEPPPDPALKQWCFHEAP